jgi:PTH1 family peptidyl-tRNA hydrolase
VVRTIVGLGNPGPEYEGTRHNAGFELADYLAKRWGLPSWRRDGGAARITRGTVDGLPVQLLKPVTYMNRSGAVLTPLRDDPDFLPARDLLVLVDDVALPVGRFRLRAKGTAGGHNGLKSVEGSLRTQEYGRLRIGVGPLPPEFDDMADYVLERFAGGEAELVADLFETMADAVTCWVAEGIDVAMNRFNRSGSPPAANPDADTT